MFKTLAFAPALLLAFSTLPASAAVLYDNGPVNGTANAFTINNSYAVSNSFTLASAATVTGVNFGVWASPGFLVTSIDWAITSTQFATPIDGTATVTNGASFGGAYGYGYYDVRIASFSTGSVALAAGTYYLVLQNAVAGGEFAYWDLNSGPSTASQNGDPISDGSESFQILTAVPEPATWAMLMIGFGLVGTVARRRAGVVAA